MARVKIAVVGCGYVGLVTALGFARAGAEVLAVEVDPARRAALRAGRVPFDEPGLGALLREVALAVEGSVDAVAGADLACVAVPTAPDASDPTEGVVRAAVRAGVGGVVLRGTLTPERAAALAALAPTVANPEFLREGHALADFLAPARVVIGGDAGVAARLVELYARILDPGVPVVCTDLASACVAKLAANAMLAVRVAFANEVGRWASASGASVVDVLQVVGLDPRIGPSHLRPSLGFGGPCLPKDARMLAPHSRLVAAALACNDDQLGWAEQAAAGAARVAVWGQSFKPGTEDARESPAVTLVARLRARGVEVAVHDPRLAPGDPAAVARGADVLVVGAEWPEYAAVDPAGLAPGRLVDPGGHLDRRWDRAGWRRV